MKQGEKAVMRIPLKDCLGLLSGVVFFAATSEAPICFIFAGLSLGFLLNDSLTSVDQTGAFSDQFESLTGYIRKEKHL